MRATAADLGVLDMIRLRLRRLYLKAMLALHKALGAALDWMLRRVRG